jgi:hypothetical protein
MNCSIENAMKNNESMHGLLITSLLAFCALPAYGDTYEYMNPIEKQPGLSIQTYPAWVSIYDMAHDAAFCEKSSRFICVESNVFNFAIPIGMKKNQNEWERGGQKYTVLRAGTFDLLGVTEKALYIESNQNSIKYTFIYSPRRGLLGIEGATGDIRRLLLTNRSFGFGRQK